MRDVVDMEMSSDRLKNRGFNRLLPFDFFLVTAPLPRSTLFPYTTLFRSCHTVPPHQHVPSSCMRRITSLVTSGGDSRSEEHTSELQSRFDLVCRLLLEKKKQPRR